MLQCSTSLWSADLSNLAAEIKRMEPYSDRFHLDVADGHYVETMLFFPDLVTALRPHTALPFEAHLMTTNPLQWIEPFVDAGVDAFIFSFDSTPDPGSVIDAIKSHGKQAGISLLISEPLELLEPYWNRLDILTICGTAMGIKGASMDPSIPAKICCARETIAQRGSRAVIEVDGGIRRDTVPLLAVAEADFIVPGSLMFREDPAEIRGWLTSLC